MIKEKQVGLTIIEISIVLLILSIFTSSFFVIKNIINSARIANAINLTANAKFANDDSLVLWLETSTFSNDKESHDSIESWIDFSKNKILFESSSSFSLLKNPVFKGLRGVYFNGVNSFQSDQALNLDEYTVFVVALVDDLNNGNILDSGFSIGADEVLNNQIIMIQNNGTSKRKKIRKSNTLEEIVNSDNLNISPEKIFLGNDSFKGQILEIIVFNEILNLKEIVDIENYLYAKYRR